MSTGSTSAKLWVVIAALIGAFLVPLFNLLRFAFHSTLYSYVLLVPVVSAVLIWQKRKSLPLCGTGMPVAAGVLLAAAVALLGWYGSVRLSGQAWPLQDYLALMTSAWLLLLGAACLRFLDTGTLRALAFPLGFLVFMAPLPLAIENALETFLQHGSALAAQLLFLLAGTTVFVDGLTFQLPGITLHVAPECSGIHSSMVLFITSVLAGYLFLRSPGRRAILALAVIPLALLRNGLRVLVIGELCVRIGPEMIDSYIHRNGGPVFFVLSLIPFFLLLYFLVRSERKSGRAVRVSAQPHSDNLNSIVR